MTRAEHLQWAKDRAYKYCDEGDMYQAFASFNSDMRKHDELKDHIALEMMNMQVMGGLIKSAPQLRAFIEGFN